MLNIESDDKEEIFRGTIPIFLFFYRVGKKRGGVALKLRINKSGASLKSIEMSREGNRGNMKVVGRCSWRGSIPL
jgi:hypothetical protein